MIKNNDFDHVTPRCFVGNGSKTMKQPCNAILSAFLFDFFGNSVIILLTINKKRLRRPLTEIRRKRKGWVWVSEIPIGRKCDDGVYTLEYGVSVERECPEKRKEEKNSNRKDTSIKSVRGVF